MGKKYCQQCQGDIISPRCIQLEYGDYDNLEEYIEDVGDRVEELEKSPEVDLKELAPYVKDRTRDEIIQILVDKVLTLQGNTPTTGGSNESNSSIANCNLDWSPIENCHDCSESSCDKLQTLINLVGQIKEKLDIW